METVGYQITNRTGRPVAVVLPDQSRAECIAIQNYGTCHELVRRSDVDTLVAAFEAGIAALHAQLGIAPAAGWQ